LLDIDAAARMASVSGFFNLEIRLGLTWRIP
jgi:hypothetical protein